MADEIKATFTADTSKFSSAVDAASAKLQDMATEMDAAVAAAGAVGVSVETAAASFAGMTAAAEAQSAALTQATVSAEAKAAADLAAAASTKLLGEQATAAAAHVARQAAATNEAANDEAKARLSSKAASAEWQAAKDAERHKLDEWIVTNREAAAAEDLAAAKKRASAAASDQASASTSRHSASYVGLAAAAALYASVKVAERLEADAIALDHAARAAAMTTDEYQKLTIGFAAANAPEVGKGLETFAFNAEQAREHLGRLYTTLRQVSPALAEQLANSKTNSEALNIYADAIARTAGEENKALLARKAFGQAGVDMLPALKEGAAGLDEMRARSEDLNIALGSDAITAAKNLSREVGLLGNTIANELSNVLATTGERAAVAFQKIREGIANISHGDSLATAFAKAIDDIQTVNAGITDLDAKLAKLKASQTKQGFIGEWLDGVGGGYAQAIKKTMIKMDAFEQRKMEIEAKRGDANKDWDKNTTVKPNEDLTLQKKPEFAGVDAVRKAQEELLRAQGDTFALIEAQAAKEIEADQRLLEARKMTVEQFAAAKVAILEAAALKSAALDEKHDREFLALQIKATSHVEDGYQKIRDIYERDLEVYEDQLDKKLISETAFQQRRELLNQIASNSIEAENKKLNDKLRQESAGYESAIHGALGTFIDGELNGKFKSLGDAAKQFTVQLITGLQKAAVEAMILKPLMASLFGNQATGGGLLSGLTKGLSSALGGGAGGGGGAASSGLSGWDTTVVSAAAEGGDVMAGVPTFVNERSGRMPEVFVPDVPGSIVPGERPGAAGGGSGGGTSSTNYNIDARGADAGVEQRIYGVMARLEAARTPPVQGVKSYTNRYPTRAVA